ncbi:MAG: zinc metallopeptidase [Schleiferiaceae bacterium]|nr:zinc metallopeptidase [Schleiferiaceae bacterium]
MLMIILIGFMIVGFIVQNRLKSKFEAYSQIGTLSGLSGREIAEKMLADSGIYDVTVQSVEGKLTDHYNPTDKTVNLSPDVYHGRSVAAAAVAAHECGHAVQHATAYSWLEFRSAMVPIVSLSSKAMNIMFIMMFLGAFIFEFIGIQTALLLIIVFQGAITLFSVVTLPVEYDASNRALAWLEGAGVTSSMEHEKAKDALKWAANTYLVSAIAAMTTLAYYIMMFLGNRD